MQDQKMAAGHWEKLCASAQNKAILAFEILNKFQELLSFLTKFVWIQNHPVNNFNVSFWDNNNISEN